MQSSSHILFLDAQTGALISEQEFDVLASAFLDEPLFRESRISSYHHESSDHRNGRARISNDHSVEYYEGRELRWKEKLPLKKPVNQHTYFSVPKIFRNRLFVVVGKPENTLFIFDQHTGSFQSKISVTVSREVDLIPVSEEIFLISSFQKLAIADINGHLLQNITADKSATLNAWAVDENLLFALFKNGVVRAWHLLSGKSVWEQTLPITARNPLVPHSKVECFYSFVRTSDHDLLIGLLDDSKHQLITLNKTSGTLLWTSEKDHRYWFTFDGDSVFFMRDQTLHRFSLHSLTITWMTDLCHDLHRIESLHIANGAAYVWGVDAQQVFTCLYVDSSGNILWKQAFPQFAFSLVVDAADDRISYQTAPVITDALLKPEAAQFALEMRSSEIVPRFM